MKRILCLLACAALCAVPAFADNGWGLYGSYWNPSDGRGTFGPGAKLSIEMIPSLQLEVRSSYNNKIFTDSQGGELNSVPLEAGLALSAPVLDRLTLYGGGGPGYYFFSGHAHAQDTIGFYGVAGLELAVSENKAFYGGTRTSLFAEAVYRHVNPDVGGGQSVDLSGSVFNVGLMLHW